MRRLLLVLLAVVLAAPAFAQRPSSRTSRASLAPPRVGVGFDVWGAPAGQSLIPEGVAVGLRTRVALPINADLSAAASIGLGAHLWEGSANARWVANPQTSLIVTLPTRYGRSLTYVLGGFGAYLPLDNRGGGAPTLHAGIGTAIPLNDTSFYLELNPSLLIGRQETTGVLAARAGVIF
jgi:hypothetical protein